MGQEHYIIPNFDINAALVAEEKEIAYHEAGHAAMQWMCGQSHHISAIRMIQHAPAVVVESTPSDIQSLRLFSELTPENRKPIRIKAEQVLMFLLAGFATEPKLKPAFFAAVPKQLFPGPLWYEMQLLAMGADEAESLCDIRKALILANTVCGDEQKARRMVRVIAGWTDEALAHPRLWAVVEALGEELLAIKTRMSGKCACQIMEKAWGGNDALPYMEMGAVWRRRFGCSPLRQE
jgi:hypothetical protein